MMLKAPVLRDQKWLDYLKEGRCIVTGLYGTDYDAIDPAHIGTLGRGIKSPDNEVLPVQHSIHVRMHSRGEINVLRAMLPDDVLRAALRAYARELYAEWLKSPHGRRYRAEHGGGR